MSIFQNWAARGRGLFSDNQGPWGSAGDGAGEPGKGKGKAGGRRATGSTPPDDGAGDTGAGDTGAGPWGAPGARPRPRAPGAPFGEVTSLDDWLKRRRGGGGGGGAGGGFGGFPVRPDGSLLGWGALALALLWLLFTTMHRIAPEERGVVTRFGQYHATLSPGIGLTLPAPFDRVQKVNVEEIRNIDLGSAQSEDLMLTGDQNIIDIAYQVRWNIRDPERYLFELAQPEETIRQVAESAMRQIVATVSLNDAIGNRRGEIEALVQAEMQQTLDAYLSGVTIQGIAIKQADPPEAVNDAFKEVTAAQQEAQSYINQANAYALQLKQKAQGEATAFDKVYDQYRLAPGVTKRRMYYETMERVLKGVDKTIVEAPGVQSYLPLNELKRAAPKGAGQ